MNRPPCPLGTSAGAGEAQVVVAPLMKPAPGAEPPARESKRRLQKGGPFFKFALAYWEREQFHALRECLGIDFQFAFHEAVYTWMREAERDLGISATQAEALTRAERKRLAHKLSLLRWAAGARGIFSRAIPLEKN